MKTNEINPQFQMTEEELAAIDVLFHSERIDGAVNDCEMLVSSFLERNKKIAVAGKTPIYLGKSPRLIR